MYTKIVTLVALLVVLSVGPGATAAQSEAYAGTHVSFDTQGDAVVDYAVDGTTMVEALAVQSTSESEGQGLVGAGADLSAVTNVGGSAVSVESSTEVRARLATESGAEIDAHDNGRGVLVVRSGGESQYVTANVSGSSSAESEGEGRVVVTAEDGTEGTFLVVGDGEVTVNEDGNVAARLGSDGKLVFRSYPEGRSDGDREQERLIAEGTAAAEVYVTGAGEGGGDFATDVVSYGEDTTVEVTERSEGTLRMTAERSQEEGRIILCTVAEGAMDAAEGVAVTVDGEAAAEASSYGELQSAAAGGENSMYLTQESSASASADVLVAVNHFSTREVAVSESGSGGDGGEGGDSQGMPGFGFVVTALALVAAAGLARSRRA